MRNAGLSEAQAGIKLAGRNINNLRYALVPQGASQGASEKSGILWSWDASLGTPLGFVLKIKIIDIHQLNYTILLVSIVRLGKPQVAQ